MYSGSMFTMSIHSRRNDLTRTNILIGFAGSSFRLKINLNGEPAVTQQREKVPRRSGKPLLGSSSPTATSAEVPALSRQQSHPKSFQFLTATSLVTAQRSSKALFGLRVVEQNAFGSAS
jgi:hypothetical protein